MLSCIFDASSLILMPRRRSKIMAPESRSILILDPNSGKCACEVGETSIRALDSNNDPKMLYNQSTAVAASFTHINIIRPSTRMPKTKENPFHRELLLPDGRRDTGEGGEARLVNSYASLAPTLSCTDPS